MKVLSKCTFLMLSFSIFFMHYETTIVFAQACDDSDGGNNPEAFGTCTASGRTTPDSCSSSTMLQERFCQGSFCSTASVNCDARCKQINGSLFVGLCSNKACVCQKTVEGKQLDLLSSIVDALQSIARNLALIADKGTFNSTQSNFTFVSQNPAPNVTVNVQNTISVPNVTVITNQSSFSLNCSRQTTTDEIVVYEHPYIANDSYLEPIGGWSGARNDNMHRAYVHLFNFQPKGKDMVLSSVDRDSLSIEAVSYSPVGDAGNCNLLYRFVPFARYRGDSGCVEELNKDFQTLLIGNLQHSAESLGSDSLRCVQPGVNGIELRRASESCTIPKRQLNLLKVFLTYSYIPEDCPAN